MILYQYYFETPVVDTYLLRYNCNANQRHFGAHVISTNYIFKKLLRLRCNIEELLVYLCDQDHLGTKIYYHNGTCSTPLIVHYKGT